MRHVSDREWELLKEQTARHLRDRSWLGGGHSILPAEPEMPPSETRDSVSKDR